MKSKADHSRVRYREQVSQMLHGKVFVSMTVTLSPLNTGTQFCLSRCYKAPTLQISCFQWGVILLFRGIWQYLKTAGRCHWHVMERGQACCETLYNT